MRIDKFLWSRILFHYKDLIDEGEISKPINHIIKIAKLKEYGHLEKEYPYSDIVWELSEKLSEINLIDNKELEKEFFSQWKGLTQEEKQYKFAKNEYKIFTKEFQSYFVKKIIENPSFEDLWFFKKNISQENLKVGLNNFFNNCVFNNLKNQSDGKIDYWENVDKNKKERFNHKDRVNLIDLLELANLKEEELNKFNPIGFLNDVLQAKFNKLLNKEVSEKFLEINEQEVYLIKVNINAINLLNENYDLNTKKVNKINEKIYELFSETIKLEKINKLHSNHTYEEIKFLAYDKEEYKEASIKVSAINKWLYDNKVNFIEYTDSLEEQFQKSMMFSWKDKIKELGKKIILESKLENKLQNDNKPKDKKDKKNKI